ncbi:MAG: metallophosphatase [Saprospiraceae bacterium]|jgi:5'-nucleotidase|nr:metallophosphatase [Saprospiraceae bacterium]
MINRRSFIKSSIGSGIILSLGNFPLNAFVDEPNISKLTILHTNDVHSRIEPFPMDGSRNQGLGGVAKRSTLINQIRKESNNVLLLDAGDIFQGTPYFNFFGGELEIKLMSEMQYDAATIGNHDFDGGMDGLVKQLPHASFPFINSNYNFSDTVLDQKTIPYKIFKKDGLKIGVFGLGIELFGLVPSSLCKGVVYNDPVESAEKWGEFLKLEKKCDYIICLSHLGYKYQENKISDILLAQNTSYIDLIIGGHTHTFMKEPDRYKNKRGMPVLVNQAGWAGIQLGRIDVFFEKNKKGTCVTCKNLFVGQSQ